MQLQYNKITNLKLALPHLEGLVIKPGETFSFWYLVGNPSQKKGYKKGLVLRQGKIGADVGGGLCQLGNLLCWMVLHSPLVITERYRHSYDVFPDVNRKVPFGAGATLAYNYIDFQFYNPTSQSFQIRLWLSDDYLEGSLHSQHLSEWTYKVEERNHYIKHEGWGGYTRHNEIFRIKKHRNQKALEEEKVMENHAIMMYNPLLQANYSDDLFFNR